MATVLTWVAWTLATCPDVQTRLRNEFEEMFSKQAADWEPDYADIENLPYLKNYFRELMRVYSPGKDSGRSR